MNYFEWEELACTILGVDYDAVVEANDEGEIEEKLYEKYGISMEQFIEIASALLKFTPPIVGGLTNTAYHAFVRNEGDVMVAIVKEEATKRVRES